MELEKAQPADIPAIMEIVEEAKAYFRSQGVNQWQDGYPNAASIAWDIQNGYGYLLREKEDAVAYASISFDGEPTYAVIEDGEWRSQDEYAVIHRVCVKNRCKGQGVASCFLEKAKELCRARGVRWLRMDTHKENQSMQKFLRKNSFELRGIIHLQNGDPRLAFDRYVSESRETELSHPVEKDL